MLVGSKAGVASCSGRRVWQQTAAGGGSRHWQEGAAEGGSSSLELGLSDAATGGTNGEATRCGQGQQARKHLGISIGD